jgi:hypothetical protein
MDMMTMMALMMAMCLGVLLLAAFLPVLGFPLGVIVAVSVGALVIVAQARLMGHGRSH